MVEKMRIGIVVQARMGSKRLPGKVLMKIGDKPSLQLLLERLQTVRNAEVLACALPDLDADIPILLLCEKLGIATVRGDEADVLSRYLKAGRALECNVIVRITGDNPFIDPQLVEEVIQFYIDHAAQYDYVSNVLLRTFPYGQEVEVVSLKCLERVANLTHDPNDHEHVTLYIRNHPELFPSCNYAQEENLSNLRMTLDTTDDLVNLRQIYDAIHPENSRFGIDEILQYVNPRNGSTS